MGQSKSQPKQKWHKQNTKIVKVCVSTSKIFATSCKKIDISSNDNDILIASSSSGRIMISRLSIDAKYNIDCKQILNEPKSSWTMCASISSSSSYVAFGGGDKTINIYNIDSNNDSYGNIKTINIGISDIIFINDKYLLLLTNNLGLLLYDIDCNKQRKLKAINKDSINGTRFDYIYLNNRHIVVYCIGIKQQIFVIDVTEVINDNKGDEYTVNEQLIIHKFKSDIIDVKFSLNGNYIAACCDDGSYEIFCRFDHHNNSENVQQIEWIFLCKKHLTNFGDNYAYYAATCIVWADEHTVMVGCDQTNDIFVTTLTQQPPDKKTVDAVTISIQNIITNDLIYIILLYLTDIIMSNYVIKPKQEKNNTNLKRISSLSSCKWGNNGANDIVVAGSWNKSVYAIIPIQK